MAINVQPVLDYINSRLTDPELESAELSLLIRAQQDITEFANYSVATEAELPAAEDNTGRFVYVQNLERFRYSNGVSWSLLFESDYVEIGRELWTWGNNNNGRLGDGTTIARSSPGTTAGGGTDWEQIACGTSGIAIKTDGTLWTWGENFNGLLGDGTTTDRSSPGTTIGGGTTWSSVSISDGNAIASAIKTDGTLWTWGSNIDGQLGDGTTVSRSSPGTTAGGGTTWSQVSAGNSHTGAVKNDGTLWTWGDNTRGQLGDGTTTERSSPGTTSGGGTNWVQVSNSATGEAVCAVKADGTLWTWGYNYYGQLGDGSTTARSSPGTTAGGGTTWEQVSLGYAHVAAVKNDGTLWTWGFNEVFFGGGRLGDGTSTNRSSPGTTAGSGTTWSKASASEELTAAIKTDGTLWTWGNNFNGQLGDGGEEGRNSPGTIIGQIPNWLEVAASANTVFAIALVDRGFNEAP